MGLKDFNIEFNSWIKTQLEVQKNGLFGSLDKVWKDIKDYEGIYQVSNLGRIKRLPHRVKNRFGTCCRKEHYIGYKGTNGYMYVLLHKDNTPSTFLIHRLVAQAFIDNPNNYDCINHKDENPLNNCVNNLILLFKFNFQV